MDTPLSSKRHKRLRKDNGDASESSDSPGPTRSSSAGTVSPSHDDESFQCSGSSVQRRVKKKKKKKRAREPCHDESSENGTERPKRKKHPVDESSLDGVSMGEDSLSEPPQESSSKENDNSSRKRDTERLDSQEPKLYIQLLRPKQNKSPLQRLLDFLHKELENKDPQQFFAWPVTDQIAPNYSSIISQPMDFSTMKQKIDDNVYKSLNDYVTDLNLMCNNAMVYNRPDTIYYKAAKRLLHGSLKLLSQEKLRHLSTILTFIKDIPSEKLGFELVPNVFEEVTEVSNSPANIEEFEEGNNSKDSKQNDSSDSSESNKMDIAEESPPEDIPDTPPSDDLSASEKLTLKKVDTNMGFSRQQQDGSTSLAIFVPGEGVDPERPRERSMTLAQVVGKLTHGTGSLLGFREDKRNIAKTVKPLYYGPFSSYAPSYDSTFSNVTKEHSDLIHQTFSEELSPNSNDVDSSEHDYTTTMVDNILDIITRGEHKKCQDVIDDQRRAREDAERIKEMLDPKPTTLQQLHPPDYSSVKIEFDQLRTLTELGIDTAFLDQLEPSKEEAVITEKLNSTKNLIERLQQLQNDRLSSAPPAHLIQIMPPSETEASLAEKIIEQLLDLAKEVPPGAITPLAALRRAMGIMPDKKSAVEESPEEVIDCEESNDEGSEDVMNLKEKDDQEVGFKESEGLIEKYTEDEEMSSRDIEDESEDIETTTKMDSIMKENYQEESSSKDSHDDDFKSNDHENDEAELRVNEDGEVISNQDEGRGVNQITEEDFESQLIIDPDLNLVRNGSSSEQVDLPYIDNERVEMKMSVDTELFLNDENYKEANLKGEANDTEQVLCEEKESLTMETIELKADEELIPENDENTDNQMTEEIVDDKSVLEEVAQETSRVASETNVDSNLNTNATSSMVPQETHTET